MTPSDLYCMAMESDVAGDHMHEICRALGTPYPPRVDDFTELTISPKSSPALVSPAFQKENHHGIYRN